MPNNMLLASPVTSFYRGKSDASEGQRRNQLLDLETRRTEFDERAYGDRQAEAQRQQAQSAEQSRVKQSLAQVEWFLATPGITKEQLAANIPEIAQGWEQRNGAGSFAAASIEQLRADAEAARIKLASAAGIRPPEPQKPQYQRVGNDLLEMTAGGPSLAYRAPQAPGAGGAGQATASIREHDYFRNLPSDEAREEYLRVKRGEQRASSGLEKRLFDVHDLAFKARSNVDKYTRIADEMGRVMPAGGVGGKWTEGFKELMGSEDAVTELRKAWNEIRVSGAINNLPPGVASDKDIALAMSAFLPEMANAETVASFLRGLSKMEAIKADYHEFEADYLSTHSSPVGMNKAWRTLADGMYTGQGGQAAPQGQANDPLGLRTGSR